MDMLLLIPFLVSFLVVIFLIPNWIEKMKKAGFSGKDMHKLDKKEVAEAGGISVLLGFILGVFSYIYIQTFQFNVSGPQREIFALVSAVLIAGFIGFVDDILGWKIGLNKKIRISLLILAAIPLMVINAGVSTMSGIEFGILFPLLLIPLGIIGATTTFNFLAGYNGLETSQGIILLSALSLVTYLTGDAWLSVIGLSMVFALLGFYVFNKCPARVFPGDVLTYPVGALIAIMAILGNIEKIAIFFFIPYIIEFILKSRGKLKKESFAKLNSDGSLEMPYKKIYGLEHLSIKILKKFKSKVYEKDVVLLINLFQIIIIGLGFLLFPVR